MVTKIIMICNVIGLNNCLWMLRVGGGGKQSTCNGILRGEYKALFFTHAQNTHSTFKLWAGTSVNNKQCWIRLGSLIHVWMWVICYTKGVIEPLWLVSYGKGACELGATRLYDKEKSKYIYEGHMKTFIYLWGRVRKELSYTSPTLSISRFKIEILCGT